MFIKASNIRGLYLMGDVVNFREETAFVMECQCGCKHFYIWDDAKVECVDCEELFDVKAIFDGDLA